MPRKARINATGVIHHIIIQEIESKKYFKMTLTRATLFPEPFNIGISIGEGGMYDQFGSTMNSFGYYDYAVCKPTLSILSPHLQLQL